MRPDLVIAPRSSLAGLLAARFAAVCRAAIDARGTAHVVVTGGSLLTQCGAALARADMDWRRVHVYFGDERAVPPSHAESNYRLARSHWFDATDIPPDQVHRMEAESPDLEAAAAGYAEVLRSALGAAPRFDLVLLGVGPDGHVCSLFPGHAALDTHDRLVAVVRGAPKPPPTRLTLTVHALRGAAATAVVAMGSDKADAIRIGLSGPPERSPLARVMVSAAPVMLVLDHDAAALIRT